MNSAQELKFIVQYAPSVEYIQPDHEKKAGVPSARYRRASWSHAFSINGKMGDRITCLRTSPMNVFRNAMNYPSDVDLSSSWPCFVVLHFERGP